MKGSTPEVETLLRTAVRLRKYDSYSDAITRGLDVGILPIEAASFVHLPQDNTIILTSHITDPQRRHDMLAYALAWADIEDTRLMRRYRAGRASGEALTRRARRIASRRLIHTEDLDLVLRKSRSAEDICEVLDVCLEVLADRLRDMTIREVRQFGRQARQLYWPAHTFIRTEHTIGIGPAVPSFSTSAMNAADAAGDAATDAVRTLTLAERATLGAYVGGQYPTWNSAYRAMMTIMGW
jgi:hypothetical protein